MHKNAQGGSDMNQTIRRLLDGKADNHMLPFFWQHGENEQTLRTYMEVIQNANCHAVCVESRPHPDFCGPKRKFKLYCPLFRTPLAWWPYFYGFAHFGTQIKGGSRRHTVTSAAITILNQLGYEHHSNCSAHCTRMSTLPLI